MHKGASRRLSALVSLARKVAVPKKDFLKELLKLPGVLYSCKASNDERKTGFIDGASRIAFERDFFSVELEAGTSSQTVFAVNPAALEEAILRRWPAAAVAEVMDS